MVGSRIGPYKIIRQISDDALGQVYHARDLSTKKHVAIRALRREAANRPETIERVYSQAKTLALLNHPHIARIFGFIRHNEQLLLVMEFIEGESLQSILKAKRRLEPAVALAYFRQILSGVAFAHNLGVIHGDLKPANLMVTPFGQIKVLDFAIAPILGDTEIRSLRASTAPYLSPEQVRSEPVDARSDIYSLGVVLYETLIGRVPLVAEPKSGAALSLRESTPLPPSLLIKQAPVWLDGFVLRALAPSASERFPTVAAMLQAMDALVETNNHVPAKPRRSWVREPARKLGSSIASSARKTNGAVKSGFSAASATIRINSVAAARTAQSGLAWIQPIEWTRRSASVAGVKLHSAAAISRQVVATRLQALAAVAARVRDNGRQTTTTVRRVTADNFAALGRELAARPKPELPRISPEVWRRVSFLADSSCRWTRAKWSEWSEAGWQRYAALAVVLASAMIEIFVFGGSNTLLMSDQNRVAVSTQHGAAESFLEPLPEPRPRTPRITELSAQSVQAKPPARPNPERKAPPKPRDSDPGFNGAWVGKRTVTYRDDSERLRTTETKPSEPIPARRSPENNVQLNVKWEN